MKYTHIIVCMLSMCRVLQGVISPNHIAELQILRKKIASNGISPLDAQKHFTRLTQSLSDYDKKDTLVTNLIKTAKEKNITLSFNNEQPGQTQSINPLNNPPEQNPAEKKEPTKSNPSLQAQTEKKTNPEDQNQFAEKQLRALKEAIGLLKKEHKTMSPNTLSAALTSIEQRIGKTPLPKELRKDLNSMRRFKEKLESDIAFINILGNEQNSFFDSAVYKNRITDPKAIKDFIAKTEEIESDIKLFLNEKIYPNNDTIHNAVHAALTTLTKTTYSTIKKSMLETQKIPDDALVRKLIRVYAQAVERFPIYSQKRIEKEDQKKLIEKNTAILRTLLVTNNYRNMEPQEVEKNLVLIEPYEYLLDTTQNIVVNEIKDYLDTTYVHVQMLEDVENFIKTAAALIATQPTNLQKINNKLTIAFSAEDDCDTILKEQASFEGKWIVQRTEETKKRIAAIIIELEKLAKIAEEKEEIEALIQATETSVLAPKEEIKPDVLPEPQIVVRPALKSVNFSESPGAEKLRKEREQADKDFVREQTEKLEETPRVFSKQPNQSELEAEIKALINSGIAEFQKPLAERIFKDPANFHTAVFRKINLIKNKETKEALVTQFGTVYPDIVTLRRKEIRGY